MQNYHNRFQNNRIEKGMFLEIPKDRDIALMEVETLGPKLGYIEVDEGFLKIGCIVKRMELFESSEEDCGCSMLGKRQHDGAEEK